MNAAKQSLVIFLRGLGCIEIVYYFSKYWLGLGFVIWKNSKVFDYSMKVLTIPDFFMHHNNISIDDNSLKILMCKC